jgi:transglutaminase-like putative cysteine protease
MLKQTLIFGLALTLVLLTANCGNPRRRTKTSKKTDTTSSQDEKQHDSVYMIVPEQNVLPGAYPNSDGSIIVPSNKILKPVVHSADLTTPPVIDFERPRYSHTRNEYIENYNIKGEMKELIFACDYDTPTVRNNSVALVALSPGNFNLGQICDIFDFCYINWSYVNDPVTREYFAKASESISNGLNGDCDDFAILLCSMILSVGGEARINFAYDETGGHAFTEVNIGKTDRRAVERYLFSRYGYTEMWHREDHNGNWWLNLDWWGEYPGAKYWKYSRGTCFNIIRNEKNNL